MVSKEKDREADGIGALGDAKVKWFVRVDFQPHFPIEREESTMIEDEPENEGEDDLTSGKRGRAATI